ncbi:hypothetical protein J6590_013660 [Homalodisca vitripennis]|nr:hypothetical protein J6590_013660 [Homalodisca vitripennis]
MSLELQDNSVELFIKDRSQHHRCCWALSLRGDNSLRRDETSPSSNRREKFVKLMGNFRFILHQTDPNFKLWRKQVCKPENCGVTAHILMTMKADNHEIIMTKKRHHNIFLFSKIEEILSTKRRPQT